MRNRGYTLTEGILSVALLSIVVLGTLQYFYVNRWDADDGVRAQLAWTNMATRMATAIELDYHALTDSMSEKSNPITLNGIQGYRSTYVNHVDDPFDGLAPDDTTLPDYLKVTITFAWFSPDNVTDSLSCSISEERGWAY